MANDITPPAGTPPAGTPPPAAATPPAATPPAPVASWTDGFAEDQKSFVQTKGFSDPKSVVDSYRNLEKLMGGPKEKLLRIPDNIDDAQAMNDFYLKLGRPATKEDYKFEVAKDGSNKDFVDFAQNTFFESGLTPKQASNILTKMTERQTAETKKSQESFEAEIKTSVDGLKKEWGAAYEQKVNSARAAARAMGLKPETIAKMEANIGYSEIMSLLDSVGQKIGEGSYTSGGGNTGDALTPAAALNKIQALKADTGFTQRLMASDAAAKAEWDKLHIMAFPPQ